MATARFLAEQTPGASAYVIGEAGLTSAMHEEGFILSDTDVEQARVMIEMGIPKAEVARAFGVSRQTLYTSLRRQASD